MYGRRASGLQRHSTLIDVTIGREYSVPRK
jgi:hypothetical protein